MSTTSIGSRPPTSFAGPIFQQGVLNDDFGGSALYLGTTCNSIFDQDDTFPGANCGSTDFITGCCDREFYTEGDPLDPPCNTADALYQGGNCMFGDSIGGCYRLDGGLDTFDFGQEDDEWDETKCHKEDVFPTSNGHVNTFDLDVDGVPDPTFDGEPLSQMSSFAQPAGNPAGNPTGRAAGKSAASGKRQLTKEQQAKLERARQKFEQAQRELLSIQEEVKAAPKPTKLGAKSLGEKSAGSKKGSLARKLDEKKSENDIFVTESSKLLTLSEVAESELLHYETLSESEESKEDEEESKEESTEEEKENEEFNDEKTEELLHVIMNKGKSATKKEDSVSRSWEDGSAATSSDGPFTLAVLSDNKLVSVLTLDNGYSIRDIAGYDNALFVLLNNGDIMKLVPNPEAENSQDMRYSITVIKNNVVLSSIINFSGYLYGVYRGTLHLLDSRTYNKANKWEWNEVKWAPKNITSISATLTGDHIFIIADDVGYLYHVVNGNHNAPKQVEKMQLGGKIRVYGTDKKNYLELTPRKRTAVKYPDGEKVTNISIGALTHDNDIIRIAPSLASRVRAIRVVNWEPYYIVKSIPE